MIQEFRKFIAQGNVLELAIAVVMGTAFGKIVSSLVENIIMPLVGLIIGGHSFEALAYKNIQYGIFIQSVVDFLLIVASIFLFIKLLSKFNFNVLPEEEEEDEEEEITPEQELLTEIRDLLKNQNQG